MSIIAQSSSKLRWPEKVGVIWAIIVFAMVATAIQSSPTPDVSIHSWFATQAGLLCIALLILIPWGLMKFIDIIAVCFISAINGTGTERR